jgi:hypothetical protein
MRHGRIGLRGGQDTGPRRAVPGGSPWGDGADGRAATPEGVPGWAAEDESDPAQGAGQHVRGGITMEPFGSLSYPKTHPASWMPLGSLAWYSRRSLIPLLREAAGDGTGV